MTHRVELQSAYILHARPYRDTSLIAEVFTRECGRIALLGRGVRGQRSRLKGVIQPFRRLFVSWSGRGELRTLTRAEEDGAPLWLTGPALIVGMYLNELVLRMMERDDPHPSLFTSYGRALASLASSGAANAGVTVERQVQERSLRIFEKDLLRELGYGLILDHDVASGHAIDPEADYRYDCTHGPSRDHRGADRADVVFVKGSSLLSLDTGELADVGSLRDAKRLLRAALARHLSGRPLHTRRLLPAARPGPAVDMRD